jgi:hypothetical protein
LKKIRLNQRIGMPIDPASVAPASPFNFHKCAHKSLRYHSNLIQVQLRSPHMIPFFLLCLFVSLSVYPQWMYKSSSVPGRCKMFKLLEIWAEIQMCSTVLQLQKSVTYWKFLSIRSCTAHLQLIEQIYSMQYRQDHYGWLSFFSLPKCLENGFLAVLK